MSGHHAHHGAEGGAGAGDDHDGLDHDPEAHVDLSTGLTG